MGSLTHHPRRRHPRRRFRPVLVLRRHRRLRQAAAVAAGVVVAASVHAALASAEDHRHRWGSTVAVAVAAADLPAGHRLGAGDVEVRSLPVVALPDGAVTEVPTGEVLRHPVARGEVLAPHRLAPSGLRGVAARLPPGTRAVAVPADPSSVPPLAVGDRVDVLVSMDPTTLEGPPGFAVAAAALVVDVGEQAVSVAVSERDAARVAFAAAAGIATLALIGA